MITLAIDRYDRHIPFFDGTVRLPPGLDLRVLQVGQENAQREGGHRHERMLRETEFDAAEVSLSSYVAACARGLPFTAIPVFPRRLFSLGQIFVNVDTGITHPAELAGRNVGLQSFQTTLAVLAKGDMAAEYGLDLKSVNWFTRSAETVDVRLPSGFRIQRLAAGENLIDALSTGRLDAIFYSRLPWSQAPQDQRIRRLFHDPRSEEIRYYTKNGYWPIMHVIALSQTATEKQPELPALLLEAFHSAASIYRQYMTDPGWSQLAWSKYAREEEALAMSADPWPLGLAANRANLERFIGYSCDQGIIDRPLAVEDLFHPSMHQT
jgi:4,5-dihydroxyphthalate decarboxylase